MYSQQVKQNCHNLPPVVATVNKKYLEKLYNNIKIQEEIINRNNNKHYSIPEIINAYSNNITEIIRNIEKTQFDHNLICKNKNRFYGKSLIQMSIYYLDFDSIAYLINKKCDINEQTLSKLILICIKNYNLSLLEKIIKKYNIKLENDLFDEYNDIINTLVLSDIDKQRYKNLILKIKIQ